MEENKNISGAVKYLQKAAVGTMLLTVSASFAFTPLAGTLEASAVEQSSYSVMTKSLSSHSYSDVQADHPAYESIQYVATNNLFGDGGTGKFSPSYPVYADMIVTSTAKVFGFAAENATDARLSLARAGFPFLLGNDKVTTYMSSQQFVLGLAYLVDGKEYTDVDKALKFLNTKKIISVEQENGKTLSESFFTDDVFTRSEFAILITRIANLAPTTNDTVLETFSKNANKTIAQLEKDGTTAPSDKPSTTTPSSGVSTYYDKDTKRNEPKLSSDDPNKWTQEDYDNEQKRMKYERGLLDKKIMSKSMSGPLVNLGMVARYDNSNNTLRYYYKFKINGKIKYYFNYKKHILPGSKAQAKNESTIYNYITVKNENGVKIPTEKKIPMSSLSKKEQKLLKALTAAGYNYSYSPDQESLFFSKKKMDSLFLLRTSLDSANTHSLGKRDIRINILRNTNSSDVKKIIKMYIDAGYLPKRTVNSYYNNFMKVKNGADAFFKSGIKYERLPNQLTIIFEK